MINVPHERQWITLCLCLKALHVRPLAFTVTPHPLRRNAFPMSLLRNLRKETI